MCGYVRGYEAGTAESLGGHLEGPEELFTVTGKCLGRADCYGS